MGIEPFLQQQVDFLKTVAQYRNETLNLLFFGFHQLDTLQGYLIVILLGWLKMGKIRGSHLYTLFFISFFLVSILKNFFAIPRPPVSLWLYATDSFSFPSGGATLGMVVYGFLVTQSEKFSSRFAFGSVIFLIALSRIYAGVHYPVDVVAGLLLGIFILSGYYSFANTIQKIVNLCPPFCLFFLGVFLVFTFYLLAPLMQRNVIFYFLTLGVFSGLCIRSYLPCPFVDKKANALICIFILVMLGVFPLFKETNTLAFYLLLFTMGLTPPLLSPAITNWLFYPKNQA